MQLYEQGKIDLNSPVKTYIPDYLGKGADWSNRVFLKGNIEDQIIKLKQQDGPDLQVHGSGNFIQTLLKYDLVDELWLKIFPITLGNGKRLFENGTIPAKFSLLDYKVSPGGVFIAYYKRDGEVKTGSFL
jgi:dihydrofolate reductase